MSKCRICGKETASNGGIGPKCAKTFNKEIEKGSDLANAIGESYTQDINRQKKYNSITTDGNMSPVEMKNILTNHLLSEDEFNSSDRINGNVPDSRLFGGSLFINVEKYPDLYSNIYPAFLGKISQIRIKADDVLRVAVEVLSNSGINFEAIDAGFGTNKIEEVNKVVNDVMAQAELTKEELLLLLRFDVSGRYKLLSYCFKDCNSYGMRSDMFGGIEFYREKVKEHLDKYDKLADRLNKNVSYSATIALLMQTDKKD